MTADSHEIHREAPTDSEGHPIHPERGHRICGARKSDRTTPTDHGRERDEYEYCLLAAGWGTDSQFGACRKHPYKGSQIGKANPNYDHGAFSEHFRSDLTEGEKEALEDGVDRLSDPEGARELAIEMAAEAAIKYKRSGDTRFHREFRQLCETFNIAPGDELSIDVSGIEAAFMNDLRESYDE